METLMAYAERYDPDKDLLRMAESIADNRRNVVLLVVNFGASLLARNLLKSLFMIRLSNILVVALDDETECCLSKMVPVFRTRSYSAPTRYSEFGKTQFNEITAQKFLPLRELLEGGFSVLLADADIAFFNNPFPFLPQGQDVAVQFGQGVVVNTEEYLNGGVPVGDRGDCYTNMCTGIVYARPTSNAIRFFSEVIDLQDKMYGLWNDQDAFNTVYRRNPGLCSLDILDPVRFPNGGVYRTNTDLSEQIRAKMCCLHANFVTGVTDKVLMLMQAGAWHVFSYAMVVRTSVRVLRGKLSRIAHLPLIRPMRNLLWNLAGWGQDAPTK